MFLRLCRADDVEFIVGWTVAYILYFFRGHNSIYHWWHEHQLSLIDQNLSIMQERNVYTVAAMAAKCESMHKILAALPFWTHLTFQCAGGNALVETFRHWRNAIVTLLNLYATFFVQLRKEIPKHRRVEYGYNHIISMELSKYFSIPNQT